MPDPICRPATTTDAAVRSLIDVPPDASTLRTPTSAPDSAREEPIDLATDRVDHPHVLHGAHTTFDAALAGLEVAEPALDHGGWIMAGELGWMSIVNGVSSQITAVIGELHEGDERLRAFADARMQGVLARLEGREDDPDVRARAAVDDGFRAGLRQADFISHTEEFRCAAEQVRALVAQGEQAVLRGEDTGIAFDRRYDRDLAFRHGVERARERREGRPEVHEAERRTVEDLQRDLGAARAGRRG